MKKAKEILKQADLKYELTSMGLKVQNQFIGSKVINKLIEAKYLVYVYTTRGIGIMK